MIDTQYYVILGIYRGFIIYQETAVIGQFLFYSRREWDVCEIRVVIGGSRAVFSEKNIARRSAVEYIYCDRMLLFYLFE